MGSTAISVRDDVYRALKNANGDGESFSDAIERLLERSTRERPLDDFAGMLDEGEAEHLREATSELRERLDGD